jgi:adenosylcobinamide-GDP ribazoletransferase
LSELGLLLVAVQALTRLPVRAPFAEGALRRAVRYFPLVGIAVGLVAWAVFALARLGLPPHLASLLSLAATLLLTGALHEDGLADCCDGLLGGRTRQDALRIMKDSRLGAFGVLGLLVVLGTKLELAALAPAALAPVALVAGHAAGRFFAVLPPLFLPYARPDGMAAGVAAPAWADVAIAACFGLVPLLLLGPRAVPALMLSGAVSMAFGLYVQRRLGGYTGDTLGAMQVLTEVAVLLAAAWQIA